MEIETQGSLLGMSYLMPLRGGLHTLDAMHHFHGVAVRVLQPDPVPTAGLGDRIYRAGAG